MMQQMNFITKSILRFCRRKTGAFRPKDNASLSDVPKTFSSKYELRETDKRLHRLQKKNENEEVSEIDN